MLPTLFAVELLRWLVFYRSSLTLPLIPAVWASILRSHVSGFQELFFGSALWVPRHLFPLILLGQWCESHAVPSFFLLLTSLFQNPLFLHCPLLLPLLNPALGLSFYRVGRRKQECPHTVAVGRRLPRTLRNAGDERSCLLGVLAECSHLGCVHVGQRTVRPSPGSWRGEHASAFSARVAVRMGGLPLHTSYSFTSDFSTGVTRSP